jgi:hypothetical protein
MYSTRGHQQIVNEYHDECLRKAKERETERDGQIGRLQGGDSAASRAPEGTSPPGRDTAQGGSRERGMTEMQK